MWVFNRCNLKHRVRTDFWNIAWRRMSWHWWWWEIVVSANHRILVPTLFSHSVSHCHFLFCLFLRVFHFQLSSLYIFLTKLIQIVYWMRTGLSCIWFYQENFQNFLEAHLIFDAILLDERNFLLFQEKKTPKSNELTLHGNGQGGEFITRLHFLRGIEEILSRTAFFVEKVLQGLQQGFFFCWQSYICYSSYKIFFRNPAFRFVVRPCN